MNSSIWFEAMDLGWFIVYTKGLQVRISKLRCTSVLKIVFNLTNSADLDEMSHDASFLFAKVLI